jgi:hypothetical protein
MRFATRFVHHPGRRADRTFHVAILLLALGSMLGVSSCAVAGSYRVADGAQTLRNYRTVAGSVQVGRDAAIGSARTVAGEIRVADGAATRSLASAAGAIRIGENARIEGDVSTVAGAIRIGRGAHVSGSVSSIAGAMELDDCRIEGEIKVTAGDLRIRGATQANAGILVRRADAHGDSHPTRLDIGAGADIASIAVERDAQVDLRISRDARVGKITGIEATYY